MNCCHDVPGIGGGLTARCWGGRGPGTGPVNGWSVCRGAASTIVLTVFPLRMRRVVLSVNGGQVPDVGRPVRRA